MAKLLPFEPTGCHSAHKRGRGKIQWKNEEKSAIHGKAASIVTQTPFERLPEFVTMTVHHRFNEIFSVHGTDSTRTRAGRAEEMETSESLVRPAFKASFFESGFSEFNELQTRNLSQTPECCCKTHFARLTTVVVEQNVISSISSVGKWQRILYSKVDGNLQQVE